MRLVPAVSLLAVFTPVPAAQQTAGGPQPVTVAVGTVPFRLIGIPPGLFLMGGDARDQQPPHWVRIRHAFDIGATEVTVRQFRAFVEATGYLTDAERDGGAWTANEAGAWRFEEGAHWRRPGHPQGDDHPVVCVNWHDAVAFTHWLSSVSGRHWRLPTEAEWEYAARGGATSAAGELAEMGWYAGNSGGRVHAVGLKKPNAWGLYDMLGNVSEWCADVWHASYDGAPADGGARLGRGDDYAYSPGLNRVLRSATCHSRNPAQLLPSFRRALRPAGLDHVIGFRVVRAERIAAWEKEILREAWRLPRRDAPASRARAPRRLPSAETVLTVRGVKFVFVNLPPGEFLMGSGSGNSDERPAHRVRVKSGFGLGKTEVTVRQYAAFVEATGSKSEPASEGWAPKTAETLDGATWMKPGFPQSDDHPAVAVSWNDAAAFCRWLAKESGRDIRLPSEAEWEYACRAGSTEDSAADVDRVAWHRDNSGGAPHAVAGRQPNAWGLYDMRGNAWEWVQDNWHPNYAGAPADGRAWLSPLDPRRVLRGASWARPPAQARPAYRSRAPASVRWAGIGFRIVCALAPQ